MIVRLNGEFWYELGELEKEEVDLKKWYKKKDIKKLKHMVTWLWGVSLLMMADRRAYASTGMDDTTSTLWSSMMPIFRMFQDIAMVLGAIALFGGLIVMMFKKNEGKKFVISTVVIIAGCFVVPAVLMLVAIIGGLVNDTLINVFENSDFRNSVPVGG